MAFLGIVIGLLSCANLLLNYGLLHDTRLMVLWLLVAIINPFFEEGYWRGLLGQVTDHWPAWLACAYPTFFFTIGHPLQWGVFSLACRRVGDDHCSFHYGHGLECYLSLYPKFAGSDFFAHACRSRKHVSVGLFEPTSPRGISWWSSGLFAFWRNFPHRDFAGVMAVNDKMRWHAKTQ